MFLYVLFAVVAGIAQITIIYGLKIGFFKSFLFAVPLILLSQYLFLYNYTKAPNFILIWFLTTAITTSLGFLLGHFVFKDVLTTYQIIGIVCIVAGMIFMKF